MAAQLFQKTDVGPLTSRLVSPDQMEDALFFWIKSVQYARFSSEIDILNREKPLPKSSPLIRLTPFIDKDGILRLGGRLANSSLNLDGEHPINDGPTEGQSALSNLLIDDAHRRTLHGGVQITLTTLRQRFWIIGGRSPVRSFVLRCVRCTRYRGVILGQRMGQLPALHTNPTRPFFFHSGVDYAGPFHIKAWHGWASKTYKAYLIVFVCFTTSAVHLELATDNSTDGSTAVYKRFTGRRGICRSLTSDCGANLVGADMELKRLFDEASEELAHIRDILAKDRVMWQFNPPSALHFGGKWEAAAKSTKYHIRRVIGDSLLTYEQFTSLLVQIEAVLNSRHLCPLSDDPNDVTALTPGYFLIGDCLNALPESSCANIPTSRLSLLQRQRQMLDHFWRRWFQEYLQCLQTVSKWQSPARQLQVGTLVLIVDERYPPSNWPLARVTTVYPGSDGLVRVASVRISSSSILSALLSSFACYLLPHR